MSEGSNPAAPKVGLFTKMTTWIAAVAALMVAMTILFRAFPNFPEAATDTCCAIFPCEAVGAPSSGPAPKPTNDQPAFTETTSYDGFSNVDFVKILLEKATELRHFEAMAAKRFKKIAEVSPVDAVGTARLITQLRTASSELKAQFEEQHETALKQLYLSSLKRLERAQAGCWMPHCGDRSCSSYYPGNSPADFLTRTAAAMDELGNMIASR